MLIAEHREIKRIPNCIKSGKFLMKGIPNKFTLGSGHVKFFYDKISYLKTDTIEFMQSASNAVLRLHATPVVLIIFQRSTWVTIQKLVTTGSF